MLFKGVKQEIIPQSDNIWEQLVSSGGFEPIIDEWRLAHSNPQQERIW